MTSPSTEVINHLRSLGLGWRSYLAVQAMMVMIFTLVFFIVSGPEYPNSLDKRSFGGWDERAETERCYKQERTATLLAFWLGVLGVDQWYARHRILAVLKMLTMGGLGVWAIIDVNLWIIGGYYGTPGCPGGSTKERAY